MKIYSLHSTSALGEKLEFSATSARSHSSAFERSLFTPSLNLSQGAIAFQLPHAPDERSQGQDSAKASQKQLQEAIAEHRLTDCLEHLESLGFLVEEQLFCLNLAQHLQRGCGV